MFVAAVVVVGFGLVVVVVAALEGFGSLSSIEVFECVVELAVE